MRKTHIILAAVLATAVAIPSLQAAAQPKKQPIRKITKIKGDLYRFQNNFHFSVFYVTPKGIIATDPINADAAKWLRVELAKRFKVPVKYVIYSHDHADHISGGAVFASTATFVGHAKTKMHIIAEKRDAPAPDITFRDRMSITLGGKQVNLIYVGKGHSDNSIVMNFPAERAVFAVDFVSANRLPFRNFPNAWIDELIAGLKKLEKMDFDILAPGHGPMGTRNHVRTHREYVEELRHEVLSRIRAGKTLEQIKAEVKMEKYNKWGSYKNWFTLNVEGMYKHMSNARRPG